MLLDEDACYRALGARDPRFDGLFFVGVLTTGIYCRCVCPARTPFRKNVRFFGSPAEAEVAGLRPCLRCRPEKAPGTANVDALGSRARLAAKRIEQGAMDEMGLEQLAAELGISGRHLRRAMEQELGVSPVQLAQTFRLLNAKRLLTDTALPVGEIAIASGFASLRRFNACFRERYRLAPTDLRKRTKAPREGAVIAELCYRPPFDWDSLLRFLSRRLIAGVESVEETTYSRTASIGGTSGWIRVRNCPERNALQVEISESLSPVLPKVLLRVRRLFDLDAQPEAIANSLGELAAANPGLRLPGAFDGFEAAARAIFGQQVTVRFATELAGRFATAFGKPIETPIPFLSAVFPAPHAVAELTQDDVARLGVIGSRARAIIAIAREIAEKRLLLTPGSDVERTCETLCEIPGVGGWTAQYICMRALSYPDAFPASDCGVLNALNTKKPAEALAAAERWRPWRAYATMHLWKTLEKPE